jgi:hypothetical protein
LCPALCRDAATGKVSVCLASDCTEICHSLTLPSKRRFFFAFREFGTKQSGSKAGDTLSSRHVSSRDVRIVCPRPKCNVSMGVTTEQSVSPILQTSVQFTLAVSHAGATPDHLPLQVKRSLPVVIRSVLMGAARKTSSGSLYSLWKRHTK